MTSSVLDRDIDRVLLTQDEINRITARIAAQIDRDFRSSKRLLLLGILQERATDEKEVK